MRMKVCRDCEALAKIKDAGAVMADPGRDGQTKVTMSFGGREAQLDAERLRDEARQIRKNCARGIHAILPWER